MTASDGKAEGRLRGLARGDLSGLESIADMGAGAFQSSGLDVQSFQLVQLAALVAVGGSPISWLAHLEAADESDLDFGKILGTLVAVAPIVGTPKVVSASAQIVRATGLEAGPADA